VPSGPRDAKGLIREALKTENPTVFLDHAKLMAIEEPVPEGDYAIPFGKADVKRAGRDITVVATSLMVQVALCAADRLAREGIDAEIIDPRTLVPFDEDAVLASVARTGRLVVVDECPLRCGVASEIAATVAEKGFAFLKASPRRVARADAPTPFSPPLEAALAPDVEKVTAAIRATLA
jgi:pyruvate dehydrogenase E1 component beta subunit